MCINEEYEEWKTAASEQAAELVIASAAKPTDLVTIAGCRHLDLLIEFFRRGFTDVTCQADRGPHDGHRPSDVLVVPTISSDLALLHLLARFGGELRPGGMLVVRDDRPLSDRRRQQLLRLLGQRGFAPVRRVGQWVEAGGILAHGR